MPCGILELIADEKRTSDLAKNLPYDGQGSRGNQYTTLTDVPIRDAGDLREIGRLRLLDTKDFNLYKPDDEQYPIMDINNIDVGIIDTPEIYDFIDVYYQNILGKNKYRLEERNGLFNVIEQNTQTEFYESYYEYIEPINNFISSAAYNAFSLYTGLNDFDDTLLGEIGQSKLIENIEVNLRANLLEETVGRLNTDVFGVIQGEPLLRKDFVITVPKTPVGRSVNYIQRLQGLTLPFSYIPEEAFSLYQTSNLSANARSSVLLSYSGKAYRNLIENTLQRPGHIYRPYLNPEDFTLQGNQYFAIDIDESIDTTELNVKYIFFEEENVDEYGINKSKGYVDSEYGLKPIEKGFIQSEPNLITDNLDASMEDSSEFINDWSTFGENNFNPKSLLYKTKQIVLEKNDLAFIDSFANSFTDKNSGEQYNISRGSSITSKGGFEADDGEIFNANDYFRVFTKGRKYNRLSRTLRHRGLDNGDTRSVLADNGLPIIAPTIRERDGSVLRKYMLSISNSAWKGNAGDLPECEKYVAPNGDVYRTMWFAPYNLSISEESSQSTEQYNFFGRPEPVYTANHTERTMNLSFSLLKDHPMIVNSIKGQRSHIWERYFKGDKSVQTDIDQLATNRLTPQEIEQFNNLKRKFQPPQKQIDNDVVPEQQAEVNKAERVDKEITPFTIKLLSIYFPNEVTELPGVTPETNANYEASNNVLGYTYLNGKQKNNRIQYRDSVSYGLNDQFYAGYEVLRDELIEQFSKIPKKVEIIFVGYASAAISSRISNSDLAIQRARNSKQWFVQAFNEIGLDEFKANQTEIIYKIRSKGDLEDTVTQDNEAGDTFNAKNNRRVDVLVNVYEQNDVEDIEPIDESIDEIIAESDNLADQENLDNGINEFLNELSSSIENKLFKNNCEYFKYLEINDPNYYNTISQKIDYFAPAFHSYTPQDFNERLTFLQQCVRSANNIGLEGDNPTNLYYGYQPFVFISVGDFFKSKALITNLSIDYNEGDLLWDLNPESGTGVEPMYAKITLQLKVIGGQSMSGAISRLQTALSYNFYSNTEMYDQRADTISFDVGNTEQGAGFEAKIIDGVNLSELVNNSELDEINNNIQLRTQQGQILSTQNRFNSPPPTQVPSEINDVNDFIQLKSFLNLELTDQERLNLEIDAQNTSLTQANQVNNIV